MQNSICLASYMAIILLLVTGSGLNARDLKAMKCDSGVWVIEGK